MYFLSTAYRVPTFIVFGLAMLSFSLLIHNSLVLFSLICPLMLSWQQAMLFPFSKHRKSLVFHFFPIYFKKLKSALLGFKKF